MINIVLKSKSPRRFDLLTDLGYKFIVDAKDVDETFDKNLSPYENVRNLALKKVLVDREKYDNYIQIGCDTIVVLDNKVYGKPIDKNDAFYMLKSLSGKAHVVMSGLAIIYKEEIYNIVEESLVFFKKLTDKEIWDYIETGECFGKAGAYAIQGIGRNLVDHYEGSFNNIVGLPTEKVEEILGEINGMEDKGRNN